MELFSFICSQCDKVHEGIPSFDLNAPVYYYYIPIEEREARAQLTSDTCEIDGEHFFAKGFLEIPIHGLEETLSFTPWVSLSDVNFKKFQESRKVANASEFGSMTGWFSSIIEPFEDCLKVKAKLILQDNNYRPDIVLEPTELPLSQAVQHGLSQQQLVEIVEYYLHTLG